MQQLTDQMRLRLATCSSNWAAREIADLRKKLRGVDEAGVQ